MTGCENVLVSIIKKVEMRSIGKKWIDKRQKTLPLKEDKIEYFYKYTLIQALIKDNQDNAVFNG